MSGRRFGPSISKHMVNAIRAHALLILALTFPATLDAQSRWDAAVEGAIVEAILTHRDLVSIPNVASNHDDMFRNYEWVTREFEALGFDVSMLESATLPVFLAHRQVNPDATTVLFYIHIDGQAVNPENWDQDDPFVPVLKKPLTDGSWEVIEWPEPGHEVDAEWRLFGRSAADDKAPITMMLTALELMESVGEELKYNVKVVLDPQEEAGSEAFLTTLEDYRTEYAADYLIIMDGPAHPTNRPTLTFGSRGIAACSITVYGPRLPQHSGHYGNYAPNPVFEMAHLLASMKDASGRVTIRGFYDEVELTPEVLSLLAEVPDDESEIRRGLGIHAPDNVGASYQESLQYPSLNVRHIETSWKGPGLKTIIPELTTAHLDVRLVKETDGERQLSKIRGHIEDQGYLVLDRDPTDEERLRHPKIAKFVGGVGVNAFRSDMDSGIGRMLSAQIESAFGEPPVRIRTMGGTIPIIPAVNTLQIPAIIVPMVNMDNNQHNPNENVRIGNIMDGIKICLAILTAEL